MKNFWISLRPLSMKANTMEEAIEKAWQIILHDSKKIEIEDAEEDFCDEDDDS